MCRSHNNIQHLIQIQLTVKVWGFFHFKETHDYSIWVQFLHGVFKHPPRPRYGVYTIILLNGMSDVAYLGIP